MRGDGTAEANVDDPLASGVLTAALVAAAVTDLRFQRIPNWLTGSALLAGLAIHTWAAGLEGLGYSAAGGLVGFALLVFFFLAGAMGGGDVKLMAAIGTLKGAWFVLHAAFYAGLVGGALALSVMIWHGTLWRNLKNLGKSVYTALHPRKKRIPLGELSQERIPFGLAISLGGLWALWVV